MRRISICRELRAPDLTIDHILADGSIPNVASFQMKIFTIGFTNKKAETFFEKLRQTGVKRVVDVRLNNISQLAGFSKKDDLKYFLQAIAGIDYVHVPDLAPTKELLDS